MNSKTAARKCSRFQGLLARERQWTEPKLFPVQARKNHEKRLARYKADADHWCAVANTLAAQEAAERAELTAAIGTLGPSVGGGGGGGVDWGSLASQGLTTVGDLATGLTAGGAQAPASGASAGAGAGAGTVMPRPSGVSPSTRNALIAVGTLAVLGTVGYVGYQRFYK